MKGSGNDFDKTPVSKPKFRTIENPLKKQKKKHKIEVKMQKRSTRKTPQEEIQTIQIRGLFKGPCASEKIFCRKLPSLNA